MERRQITRQGGRSCKAMLNTSLPLEQLPHPPQLYGVRVCGGGVEVEAGQGVGRGGGGEAGSARVPAISGQLPGLFFLGAGRWLKGAGPQRPRSSRTPLNLRLGRNYCHLFV